MFLVQLAPLGGILDRAGHAVADYVVAVFRICTYIFNMCIIRILIYAVYADKRIMRMSFPNRICKRIYQQIQAFVFQN